MRLWTPSVPCRVRRRNKACRWPCATGLLLEHDASCAPTRNGRTIDNDASQEGPRRNGSRPLSPLRQSNLGHTIFPTTHSMKWRTMRGSFVSRFVFIGTQLELPSGLGFLFCRSLARERPLLIDSNAWQWASPVYTTPWDGASGQGGNKSRFSDISVLLTVTKHCLLIITLPLFYLLSFHSSSSLSII